MGTGSYSSGKRSCGFVQRPQEPVSPAIANSGYRNKGDLLQTAGKTAMKPKAGNGRVRRAPRVGQRLPLAWAPSFSISTTLVQELGPVPTIAKTLQLDVPPTLLARAGEVIE